MKSSLFLTFDEVIEIHADQISRYGGSAGIRDEGLLRSALAQPETSFGGQYLHESLSSQAAAYLYHLVQNHPFIDGNKRIGLVCALVFLEINDHELNESLDEIDLRTEQTHLETIVLEVACGKMNKEALIRFFETNIKRRE